MPVLTQEFRGGILENEHHGRLCAVGENGVLAALGDIEQPTFYRSASKPLQALPVIMRGLTDKYGFTPRETAIMAGSHAGERIHLQTILSMLDKAGLREDELIMKPAYPAYEPHRLQMLREGLPPRKALHNCAGKHIGAMLLQRELTGGSVGYHLIKSPAQQEIIKTISAMSSFPLCEIGVGTDGCGVPVFAVPLRNMAASFLRLACPELIEDAAMAEAARRMAACIAANPQMMRGTGYMCSYMNSDANLIAKGGALGVYCFALKKQRVGVAFKIEDGTEDSWPIVARAVLERFGHDNAELIKNIMTAFPAEVRNNNDDVVGIRKSAFTL